MVSIDSVKIRAIRGKAQTEAKPLRDLAQGLTSVACYGSVDTTGCTFEPNVFRVKRAAPTPKPSSMFASRSVFLHNAIVAHQAHGIARQILLAAVIFLSLNLGERYGASR